MEEKSIIVIGGGFAGLSAGIYGRMNGYHTEIFEMHNLPGGLCTAWKRKGYTVDACIHWLVGSSPRSFMHRYWEEVGIAQGRKFIDMDEFMRYEGADGRTFILYTDLNRLEKHMLEFSPRDADATRRFIEAVRTCLKFEPPSEFDPLATRVKKGLSLGLTLIAKGGQMKKWMGTTAAEFAGLFEDPLIAAALREIWFPEFSVFFLLFTLAWLHAGSAGYPIGGSLPMSRAMAERYLGLGGAIHYDRRVTKILVEEGRAVGVRLSDGTEHRAGRVVSAADGYTTIFNMLDGKYVDEKIRTPYAKWPTFPSLLFVGVGVNRSFADQPRTVSGISFPFSTPVEIGGAVRERMTAHIFNQDPTLAPEGKTSLTVMMPSSYEYWRELGKNRSAYEEKKSEIGRTIVRLLDERFPGLAGQVEMVDVATPLTFERYTGNWKGSFEGWLITPQNAYTTRRPMPDTLPGLRNFRMCGQWVQPGGGLPTGVMSGRRLVQALCKEDGKKFRTSVA